METLKHLMFAVSNFPQQIFWGWQGLRSREELFRRRIGWFTISNKCTCAADHSKNAHSLLDIINVNKTIYYILSSGVVKVATISPDLMSIQVKSSFTIKRIPVEDGYFVISAEKVIFLNQNSAYFVDVKSTNPYLEPLSGYTPM